MSEQTCKAPEWCGLGEFERGTPRQRAWMDASGPDNYVTGGVTIRCGACATTSAAGAPAKAAVQRKVPEVMEGDTWECTQVTPVKAYVTTVKVASIGSDHIVTDEGEKWSGPAHVGTVNTSWRLISRVAPMEASKPAGEFCGDQLPNGHRCKLNDGHAGACSMWRAEAATAQPAKAAAKVPVCLDCDLAPCAMRVLDTGRRVLLCDDCYLSRERSIFFDTTCAGPASGMSCLHDDKQPERLPKPKMAHVAGLHDDELLSGEGTAR